MPALLRLAWLLTAGVIAPSLPIPVRQRRLAREKPQILAWVYERPGGGRGFGFSGGHFHRNWANGDYRKLVINAVVWLAKIDVPADGVDSVITEADLSAHLDDKPRKRTTQ